MQDRVAEPSTHGRPPDEQSCPGLARALGWILSREERPEVLDLGQFCKSAAVYLADRGARVSVEDFEPPAAGAPPESGQDAEAVEPPPVIIRQPDARFELVLGWEHPDFFPPERLDDLAAELRRVMAPGGWLLLFAQDLGEASVRQDRPGCYRLTADDRIVRSGSAGPLRPRWGHSNRLIEQALHPLAVQSIHLQRNRIREFLARKPMEG